MFMAIALAAPPCRLFGTVLLICLAATACANSTPPPTPSDAIRPTERAPTPLACGPQLTCDPAKQYCSILTGGPVGVPPSYACTALPAACGGTPTCECIGAVIGCTCTGISGRVSVTCTAP